MIRKSLLQELPKDLVLDIIKLTIQDSKLNTVSISRVNKYFYDLCNRAGKELCIHYFGRNLVDCTFAYRWDLLFQKFKHFQLEITDHTEYLEDILELSCHVSFIGDFGVGKSLLIDRVESLFLLCAPSGKIPDSRGCFHCRNSQCCSATCLVEVPASNTIQKPRATLLCFLFDLTRPSSLDFLMQHPSLLRSQHSQKILVGTKADLVASIPPDFTEKIKQLSQQYSLDFVRSSTLDLATAFDLLERIWTCPMEEFSLLDWPIDKELELELEELNTLLQSN